MVVKDNIGADRLFDGFLDHRDARAGVAGNAGDQDDGRELLGAVSVQLLAQGGFYAKLYNSQFAS